MKYNIPTPHPVLYIVFAFFTFLSCAKDNDLFLETTLEEEEIEEVVEENTDSETETEETQNAEENNSTENEDENIPVSGDNVYFVTMYGNSSNDGKSEAKSWNVQHAFSTAKAGDIIYIKAGIYEGFNLTQNNDGTNDKPIYFIGYQNTPGDINQNTQNSYSMGTQSIKVPSSFTYGDQVDSSKMPLFQENSTTSLAFNLKGDFVNFYNFQIKNYGTGLMVNGNNCNIKNIIAIDQGNQNSRVAEGFSVNNLGNNNYWKNIYIENGGQQGFRNIFGTNNHFDAITVTCDNNTNATDYYFLLEEGSNNLATNIYVKRIGNLEHYGHGIVCLGPI